MIRRANVVALHCRFDKVRMSGILAASSAKPTTMIFANAEIDLPEDLGEITIEGEMPCSVCAQPMTLADIENSGDKFRGNGKMIFANAKVV